MKKIITFLLMAFLTKASIAQNYNPAVWAAIVSPAPMVTGFGTCSFFTGNLGNNPLGGFAAQPMRLTITLSRGVPNNPNPIVAISGTMKALFNWVYNSTTLTYTGTQNQIIAGNSGGSIIIAYKVTQASTIASPQNGFNVNVTPPAYTNPQATNDDNVSSYTYGTAGGTLPVKLSAFDAAVNNCITTLSWKSSTEVNFSKYMVEYSMDGINFSTIYSVDGKGDNSSYIVTQRPAQGKAYYRLKMEDIDSKAEYSRVIALNINCSKTTFMVYPNPTSDVLNINVTSADNKGTKGILYNQAGQSVLSMNLPNGSNQVDITRLAPGIYHLRFMNNSGFENIKVVIE